jgi:predicted thioredoxin/glutaredoxin
MNEENQKAPPPKMSARFRLFLWARSTQLLAPEAVRQLYLGILGREPDPEGFKHHTHVLANRKENFQRLVTGMAQSVELKEKAVQPLAAELVRELYLGVLGRDPEPEAFRQHSQTMAAAMMGPDKLRGKIAQLIGPELVRELYLGILGREPVPEALKYHSQALAEKKETLQDMATILAGSDEFKAKIERLLAPELVLELYQGFLGREPSAEALKYHTQALGQKQETLQELAAAMAASDEARAKIERLLAPELVRELYLGILGREPDPEGFKHHSQALEEKRETFQRLAAVMSTSEEFKAKHAQLRAPELVRDIYLGLLGREPDPEILKEHAQALAEKKLILPAFVAATADSDEFRAKTGQLLAPELVRQLYLGILGREPDPEPFQHHAQALAEKRETVQDVAAILASSDEFNAKIERSHAPGLVRDVYLGILGREPDPETVKQHTEALAEKTETLRGIVAATVGSDEFKEKTVQLLAPDLVRQLYFGILGREPDPEGFQHHTEALAEKRETFQDIAAGMAASDEFKGRAAQLVTPDLVRELYLGILGREPDPEGLDHHTRALVEKRETFQELAAGMATSDEFKGKAAQLLTPDLVRDMYLGILGREPDPEGFKHHTEALAEKRETLQDLAAGMAGSEEFKGKAAQLVAPELVRDIYLGLLGREPDPEGLKQHTEALAEKRQTFQEFVAAMAASDEFKSKATQLLAPELVRDAYLGILGREPDPDAFKHHTEALAEKRETFQEVLAATAGSDELKEKAYPYFAKSLAQACFHGILKRDADEAGLQTYTARLTKKEDLEAVMAEMIGSGEFKRTFSTPAPVPDPARTYDHPTWAFIHIEKTAGTALQNLLDQAFPPGMVLRGHANVLFVRSAGELSKYTVFAGHFNYDALAYIPRKTISALTFVREPSSRLSSLYHFLRAHDPEHPSFGFEAKMANELDMEDYYRDSKIQEIFWNRMTWAVMGQRQWLTWKRRLFRSGEPAFSEDIIATVIRPAMRERLRKFAFIGLQEDYDQSVELLFKVLGKPKPPVLPRDHSLEHLITVEPHFKRHVEKQPITSICAEAMDQVAQLDRVLYQEAKIRYSELLIQPIPPTPAAQPPPSAGDPSAPKQAGG